MKQNVMKRTLAGILAVLTVAAYVPANVGGFLTESTGIVMGVSAEEATSVSSAEALEAAVEAGGAVQLTANIDLTETLNVTKDVTIDLNGYNITAVGFRAFHVKKGTLTLSGTGTGTIASNGLTDDSKSVIRVGDNEYSGEANLIIGENVIVSSDSCYGVSVFGNKTTETVSIFGTVAVTGTANAISGNGSTGYGGTTINIYPGAEVSAENDVAIYHPQAGTLNITGGRIEGLGGIEAKAGTAAISIKGSDTSIIATAEKTSHKANGNGTSTRGYAIAAVENAGYAGSPQIIVSGGDIVGPVELVKDNAVADEKKGAISITGGRFISGSQKTDVSAYFDTDTYSQDDYGYVRETAAIYWDEIEDATGKTYFSVDPRYLTVFNGETVKLRKDVETNQIYVPNGYKGSIDLNGHDLSLNGYAFVGYNSTSSSYADLTIKNTGAAATLTGLKSNYQTLEVYDYGKLTIGENVTVTTEAAWTLVPHAYNTIDIYGTVTNTYSQNSDGESDSGYAISGNARWSMGTVINVYDDAVVSAPYGNAIYQPHDGTLNVYGGTVSGLTAIYARTGNVNISGGTISANGDVTAASAVANGADPTGDALAIQVYTESYGAAPKVSITGGTFNSEKGSPVAAYWTKAIDEAQVPTKFITGGNYNKAINRSLIADGYERDDDGNVIKSEEPVTVTTFDFNGNSTVQSFSRNYTEGDYVLPQVYLDGYTLTGWNISSPTDYYGPAFYEVADVATANHELYLRLQAGNDVVVKPVYEKNEVYPEVVVTNGVITNLGEAADRYSSSHATFRQGTVVKVKADEAPSGQKFSHWEKDGVIVSYNETYSFYASSGEISLVAYYVDDETAVEPSGTGYIESVSRTKFDYMAFVSVLNVPDGCKMLKAGVVYQKTNDLAGKELTVANAKKIKYTDTSKNNYRTFKYTFSLGTNNHDTYWTVRPYLEYKDKNGTIKTIYGNPVSYSINSSGSY